MRAVRSSIILMILLASVFLLSGCRATLLVHNAKVNQVIPILEDYAGTHGYQMTYRNDEAGSYRLSLGSVFVPEVSETTKSRSVIVQPPPEGSNLPMTSYEDSTMRTVTSPGHYVEAYAMISIVQQGGDAQIIIDANDAAGVSLDDFKDYLKSFGFNAESK